MLLALGFPQATLDSIDLEHEKFDTSKIVSKFQGDQKETIKGLLKNEGFEKRDDIVKETEGKVRKTIARTIRKTFPELGLSEKDAFEMKTDDLITKAKATKAAGTEDGKEQIQQLQDKNVELTNQITKLNEEEIPRIRAEAESKVTGERVGLKIRGKLAKLKGDKTLLPSIEGAFTALSAIFGAKYDIDINEAGEVEFYVKGTDKKQKPQAKVNNVEKILSSDELINLELDEFEFLAKSNGGSGGGAGDGGAGTGDFTVDTSKVKDTRKKESIKLALQHADKMQ